MKSILTSSLTVSLLLVSDGVQAGLASEPGSSGPATASIPYEVRSRRMIKIPGEERKMIMERVKPPILPLPAPEALPVPPDPAVLAARRAAWKAHAPLERRILSITAIGYANGLSFLQWSAPHPDHHGEVYEAWSRTDFRSLWLVQQFEIDGTEYLFPVWLPAGRFDLQRSFPDPLRPPSPADSLLASRCWRV